MVPIGHVVTELCCHKINMNTKEKHIIQSILKIPKSHYKGLSALEGLLRLGLLKLTWSRWIHLYRVRGVNTNFATPKEKMPHSAKQKLSNSE